MHDSTSTTRLNEDLHSYVLVFKNFSTWTIITYIARTLFHPQHFRLLPIRLLSVHVLFTLLSTHKKKGTLYKGDLTPVDDPPTTLVQPVCDGVRAYPVNDPMYTRDGKFHVFFSPFLQQYFQPFYANTVVVDVQRLIFDIPAMPKNCHDASWHVGHDGAVQQSVFLFPSKRPLFPWKCPLLKKTLVLPLPWWQSHRLLLPLPRMGTTEQVERSLQQWHLEKLMLGGMQCLNKTIASRFKPQNWHADDQVQ